MLSCQDQQVQLHGESIIPKGMTPPKKYPRSLRQKDAYRCIARCYTDVVASEPKSYSDDTFDVVWGDQDKYEVTRQLGKGKYGEVFEGINLKGEQQCVIKIMRPVKEQRLRRELKILSYVAGGPNIVKLLDVVRDPDTKTPCFVFEFVNATNFKELLNMVCDMDIRLYIYQLLEALDFTHSKGIVHRDIKPANVLIDHDRKCLRLIDWGLADFYHPGKEYPVRVATRFYKGPELLVDLKDYDYSLDVWGVGCMLAALIFKRPVFFKGEDEFDQLVKIARVLGTDDLYKYAQKYGIELDVRLMQLCGYRPRVSWKKFINAENKHLAPPEALDLLNNLLKYDHSARLTCQEALAHSYFDPVRKNGGA